MLKHGKTVTYKQNEGASVLMDINIFTILGQIVVAILVVLLILIIITLILGLYLIKSKKLLFPRLLIFTLNITYPTIKYFLDILQLDDLMIDRISIDLRNKLNKDDFKKLDAHDVIMVLPHCLRANNCPAVLGPSGLECVKCGNCCIGTIKHFGDLKGINIYIVPGSTFIKNVLKKRPFKGVIGVACPIDLNKSMTALSNFTVQGVYLLKDGCINTMVNVDEVIDLINQTQPHTEYNVDDFK